MFSVYSDVRLLGFCFWLGKKPNSEGCGAGLIVQRANRWLWSLDSGAVKVSLNSVNLLDGERSRRQATLLFLTCI